MTEDVRARKDSGSLLSVIVPVYNEESGLMAFHERLSTVLNSLDCEVEVIYVNDGSSDNSKAGLCAIRERDGRVSVVDLSRNFGKEIALTAGLDHSAGDAVVMIDSDMQHPPELIRSFLESWRDGYDVVYGVRKSRLDESVLKRNFSRFFYKIMTKLGPVALPENAGDFRLLSRRAANALIQLREQHRFMKGLYAWIGFSQKAIPFEVEPRLIGITKWGFSALWTLSVEAITSFTIAPLKLSTYLGLLTAIGASLYGLYIIINTLLFGSPTPGFPTLMVVILMLGGIQLITLGVIGEYLGRVFNESKNRPLYFVKEYLRHENDSDN